VGQDVSKTAARGQVNIKGAACHASKKFKAVGASPWKT